MNSDALRILKPEIRVTTRGVRLAIQPTASMAAPMAARMTARLATGVLAHYGWYASPLDSLPFVFRQLPAGGTVVQRVDRSRYYLAPRLALTLRVASDAGEGRRPTSVSPIFTAAKSDQPSLPAPPALDLRFEVHRTPVVELVSRLSARAQRLDSVSHQETPLPGTTQRVGERQYRLAVGEDAPPSASETRRVVRRSAPHADVPPPAHQPAIPEVQVQTPRPSASYPALPGTLTSGDLNRLADQVIQTIDRRIIAQRERLGRL